MKTPPNPVKVLVVDDHAIVRAGLSALLETEGDIRVVGQAKNGEEALRIAAETAPDVILMDLVMPRLDGVEATARLRASAPGAKVVILTTFGTSDGIAHALAAGARGALLKNTDPDRLLAAIRAVAAGGTFVSPEIRRQLAADPPVPDLTPRQGEILESLARGLTDRDIARQFDIRLDGVNEHVSAILRKLGAANRTEAVSIALRKHLAALKGLKG